MTRLKTTKADNALQKSLLIPLFTALCLTTACSEDTGKQEISQKIEIPLKETIVKDTGNEEILIEKAEETSVKAATPGQSDAPNSPETPNENPQTDVEKEIAKLEARLKNNNQDNAALRQHMEVLLKKVKENQRKIDQFEQTKD